MLSNLAAHSHGCRRISRSKLAPRLQNCFHAQLNCALNFNSSLKLKYRQIKKFLALRFLGVVFIMLINVKMPTIVGIFNIDEQDKFRAQLS